MGYLSANGNGAFNNMVMQYDVLLTDTGSDDLSVALAVMNTIQQALPLAVVDVNQARDWLAYCPILLRRGIAGDDARVLQQRYEQLGGAVAILPSKLFFPSDAPNVTRWRNEWFSEHLVALHERVLSNWAWDSKIDEAYRFSYLPTYGTDVTLRVWTDKNGIHASARRSIGRIGPLPGPPRETTQWQPTSDQWAQITDAMKEHRFWEADSWDTVPEGYTIVGTNHWVMEGIRGKNYKVLVDQTPNEGSAREVGLLLVNLLPDDFAKPPLE
ncbi:MAG: hypothetical protein AAFQ52_05120 [Chloroflexota bacterium]